MKAQQIHWIKVSDEMPPMEESIIIRRRNYEGELYEVKCRLENWATQEDLINYGINEWRTVND